MGSEDGRRFSYSGLLYITYLRYTDDLNQYMLVYTKAEARGQIVFNIRSYSYKVLLKWYMPYFVMISNHEIQ